MGKKLLLLGFILVLLIAIPLFVYIVQKQQETRIRAAPSTTLAFSPPTVLATAGATLKLDIMITPQANQVSFVKLIINYDPTKLTKKDPGLVENKQLFPSVLEGPTYDETTSPATATISLSVGADPAKVITGTAAVRIASINFEALAPTTDTNPTKVTFGSGTQALSIGSTDAANENVIQPSSLASSAEVSIASGPTPTPTQGPPSTSSNNPPVCSSLSLDRQPVGTAPFSIAFTAVGTDSDGAIQKVTFDFGDGPVQDVTQGATLGTNSVNVQISHTFHTAGTFNVTSVFTDDKGGLSDPAKCAQTITVNPSSGGALPEGPEGAADIGGVGSEGAQLITQAPQLLTPTPSPTEIVNLPPPGPGDRIFQLGGIAIILAMLGAFLLFAL